MQIYNQYGLSSGDHECDFYTFSSDQSGEATDWLTDGNCQGNKGTAKL